MEEQISRGHQDPLPKPSIIIIYKSPSPFHQKTKVNRFYISNNNPLVSLLDTLHLNTIKLPTSVHSPQRNSLWIQITYFTTCAGIFKKVK
jgi:hypothetical protein